MRQLSIRAYSIDGGELVSWLSSGEVICFFLYAMRVVGVKGGSANGNSAVKERS